MDPIFNGLIQATGNKKRKRNFLLGEKSKESDSDGDAEGVTINLGDGSMDQVFPDTIEGDEEERKPKITKKPCTLRCFEIDEEKRKKKEEKEGFDRDSPKCELCRISNKGKNIEDLPEKLKEFYAIFEDQYMHVKPDKIFEIMAKAYNSTIYKRAVLLGNRYGLKKVLSSEVRRHMTEHEVDVTVRLWEKFHYLERSTEYLQHNGIWEKTYIDDKLQEDAPLEVNTKNYEMYRRMVRQQMDLVKLIQQTKIQNYAIAKTSSIQKGNSFTSRQFD